MFEENFFIAQSNSKRNKLKENQNCRNNEQPADNNQKLTIMLRSFGLSQLCLKRKKKKFKENENHEKYLNVESGRVRSARKEILNDSSSYLRTTEIDDFVLRQHNPLSFRQFPSRCAFVCERVSGKFAIKTKSRPRSQLCIREMK